MCVLQIQLLGGLNVTAGTTTIDFGYDKVRALLAYLVVEADHPHRRGDLAALLWPNRPEPRARQSLSQAIYALRRALASVAPDATFLLTDAQSVRWQATAPFCTDIDLLRRAESAWHEASPGTVSTALEAAAAAYTGEFLAGFALPEAHEFEAWVTIQREHFHQLALETLRRLADRHEHHRAFDTALGYARRRLALDNWQEDAHRQIMRLLEALGQPDAALAQYRECRALLAAELGVAPAAATELLHRQIAARQRTALAPPALPVLLTPLLGRDRELFQLTSQLATPDCRFLTLVGPGGSGKSHLALAAAHQLRATFADGAVFVTLAGLTAATEILPTIAHELGLRPGSDEEPAQHLSECLRPRSMLLVLDNMEHLIAGVPQLTHLLERAPGIKILATSRVVLHAAGEHVLQLGGLALDRDVPAGTPAGTAVPPASALFIYHMRRRQPGFAATPAELETIATICRQVDGMPLAILLAAALTTTSSLAELARTFADLSDEAPRTLDLLTADWPDLPLRQRSMRTVVEHSWRQLPAATQTTFAGLSVFRDGFTMEAARAVVGIDILEMRALTDWSLITPVPGDRFAMHELLRQYGAEQLRLQGRTNVVRSRHTAYFSAYCAAQGAALCGAQQQAALAAFAADLANILAAWRAAAAAHDHASMGAMADGLCRFLEWRGRGAQGVELCDLALTHSDGKGPTVLTGGGDADTAPWSLGDDTAGWESEPDVRARLITWKARLLDGSGQPAGARAGMNALLNAPGQSDCGPLSDDVRAFALRTLGWMNIGVDTTAADALLHESLRIYRATGARWDIATTLVALGDLHVLTAAYAQAQGEADEAARIAHACGDQRLAANALRVKSACYGMQGHLQQAEDAARAGIAILRALDDRHGVADTLMELASKYVYAGEFEQATRLWDEIETIAQALGTWRLQAMADHFRGWSHTNLGHYALAEEYYLSAERLYAEADDHHMLALGALGRGELRLALDEYQDAYALLREAANGLGSVGQADEAALARGELVLALRGLGQADEAWAQLRTLLRELQSANAFPPLQNAVNVCALLLSDTGEVERAVELHALAAQHPYIARSVYRHDVIGRAIAERAARLSPARRAALAARGRGRDMLATVMELRQEFAGPCGPGSGGSV